MSAKVALVGLLLLTAAAPPTVRQAQEADRASAAMLQAQRAALSKAAAAAADEQRLGAERVIAAAALRQTETAADEAADKVAALSQRRTELQTEMAQRSAEMAPFLPIIQRLALYPAETLLAVPMPAERAVRGILVLGGLTRKLEQDAIVLRTEQQTLASLSTELNEAIPVLAARQAEQARQAAALDQKIDAARALRQSAEGEAAEQARRAAVEASRATSLRAAIARLDAERAATEARLAAEERKAKTATARADIKVRQEAAARPTGSFSTLVSPVAGTVVHFFGDTVDGGAAPGMTYQVPPSARVVAPCGGRVVYSGPFRSFGLLVILDCGSGWHVVLSGFDRLDAALGQSVQAGEPIGAMPGWDPLAILHRPTLMLELRRAGQPVNPSPFLRAQG